MNIRDCLRLELLRSKRISTLGSVFQEGCKEQGLKRQGNNVGSLVARDGLVDGNRKQRLVDEARGNGKIMRRP